jgi:outer membrane protein assembly factor BamB
MIPLLIAALAALVLCLSGPGREGRADDWPQFRGPNRDGISRETGLLRKWPEGGPKVLWSTEVCDGYAAAAILGGRVYFNDYDRAGSEWLVRCLTLEDGKELWRFREKKKIRPNHGITRTIPAVDGKYVFSIDPKCALHCLDAGTGAEIWRQDFVLDYGSQIPPWYTGQCPLIEADRIIVAPGGKALMVALEKATGKPIWTTPNTGDCPASHASVMPAEIGGVKQYLHVTLKGSFGVSSAVAFVGAQTIVTSISLFKSGLQPGGDIVPWIVRLVANRRLHKDEARAAERFAQGLLPEETKGY